jgi:hypothetical protein
MNDDGTPAAGGPMPLRSAFFLPNNLATPGDLECLLKGLAMQTQQEVDLKVVDGVRNFLFGEPTAGAGFDLASLNIQRGRDHGLADYNTIRVAYGLTAAASFADVTSNVEVQNLLASLYGTIDNIDVWIGALAEDHMGGSSLGPLLTAGLVDQFTRARDGDRFWYENDPAFSADEIRELQATRLSDILRRNTNIAVLQDNVFVAVPEPSGLWLATCAAALALGWRASRRRRHVPGRHD